MPVVWSDSTPSKTRRDQVMSRHMIGLTRVEVYRDGVLVDARTVPNLNVARVYMARQEAAGLHALLIHPRTDTELTRP